VYGLGYADDDSIAFGGYFQPDDDALKRTGIFACSKLTGCSSFAIDSTNEVYAILADGNTYLKGGLTILGDLYAEENVWGTKTEYYVTVTAEDSKCDDGDFVVGIRTGNTLICRSI
jgi:hypothetical protein